MAERKAGHGSRSRKLAHHILSTPRKQKVRKSTENRMSSYTLKTHPEQGFKYMSLEGRVLIQTAVATLTADLGNWEGSPCRKECL